MRRQSATCGPNLFTNMSRSLMIKQSSSKVCQTMWQVTILSNHKLCTIHGVVQLQFIKKCPVLTFLVTSWRSARVWSFNGLLVYLLFICLTFCYGHISEFIYYYYYLHFQWTMQRLKVCEKTLKVSPPPKDLGCISFDKICDKFYLDYFS